MTAAIDVLRNGLITLFKTGEFCNFKIICGKYDFAVHKAIISAQSEYFDAACKRDRFVEGEKNSITLLASGLDKEADEALDDPEAVMLMVHFFYHLDYDVAGSSSSGSDMVMHAKVFACAIKYQTPGLKTLSVEKFAAAVDQGWNHHSFAEVIKFVYDSTPAEVRELRDIVANALHDHQSLLDKPEIEDVLGTITKLAFELLRLARKIGEVDLDAGRDGHFANCHGHHGAAYRDICGDCEQSYCYYCSNSCPFCYLD